MTSMETTGPRRLPLDKLAVGLALVLALVAILGAWGSQIFGGLVPCELCWGQRIPYYWGVPVLALILLLWNRIPLAVWYIAILVAAAIFVWSAYLGGFHAGVEWGFWPGPTACTGLGTSLPDITDLSSVNLEPVVQCDHVQFRDPIFQISLAGYNALLSALIVVLLLAAALFQSRRKA